MLVQHLILSSNAAVGITEYFSVMYILRYTCWGKMGSVDGVIFLRCDGCWICHVYKGIRRLIECKMFTGEVRLLAFLCCVLHCSELGRKITKMPVLPRNKSHITSFKFMLRFLHN